MPVEIGGRRIAAGERITLIGRRPTATKRSLPIPTNSVLIAMPRKTSSTAAASMSVRARFWPDWNYASSWKNC